MTATPTPVTLSIKIAPGEENLIRQYVRHLFPENFTDGIYDDKTPLDLLLEALLHWGYDETREEMYAWYATSDEAVDIAEFKIEPA